MYSQFNLYLLATLIINSMAAALPIEKRRIVTRVYTASTTNVVTDFYSTTTEIIIAPTVEYIISGDVTFTTTIYPVGVASTATPITTVTSVVQKDIVPTISTVITSSTTPSPVAQSTLIAVGNVNVAAQTTYSPVAQTTNSPVAQTTQQPAAQTTHSPVAQSTLIAVGNVNVAAQTTQQPAVQTTPDQEQRTTTTLAPVESSKASSSLQSIAFSSTTTSNSGSTDRSKLSTAPVTITYSPYNNDGSCKSSDAVLSDLTFIKSKGISKIRMYGTDCNSLETVEPACVQLGITINQGLWIDSNGVDSLDSSLQALITYGQTNGWDIFDFITVGNEAINSGYCSVFDLINKIASVKSQLQSAGYPGEITTSEPPVTFLKNPELCISSDIDFVGINAHSYFDIYASAESSGTFVKGQLQLTQNACGSKTVSITETGYPSQGIQNGGNIPSKANQLIAVQAIFNELGNDVTILSAFDDFWKNPGKYGIEQYFGISDLLPTV